VSEFRDLGVGLPSTVDENLRGKPGVQSLAQLGQAAYLGALRGERAQLDYVNFYAHLHRLVDDKLGRVLAALGSGEDPRSLRARTMIVRFSDHGELGLAHGGLRQKMFNAYEETIHVPLIVSNPFLFAGGATSAAPASRAVAASCTSASARRSRRPAPSCRCCLRGDPIAAPRGCYRLTEAIPASS
jgi:choline-sulfatase